MSDIVPGIKLIKHNASNVNLPDDPTLPFKLEADFRTPEFMIVMFVGLYGGGEEIIVRGETKEALDKFIEANNLRTHPRLRQLIITGPDGIVEQLPEKS